MTMSNPGSSGFRSKSVTTAATSTSSSVPRSRPVISQSIQTRRSAAAIRPLYRGGRTQQARTIGRPRGMGLRRRERAEDAPMASTSQHLFLLAMDQRDSIEQKLYELQHAPTPVQAAS